MQRERPKIQTYTSLKCPVMARVAAAAICLCALFSLTPLARAQEQSSVQPLVNFGDALVSGFSGVRERVDPSQRASQADDLRLFIDPDGASLRGFDLSSPGGQGPLGQSLTPEFLTVTARDIGQVFGIALDDAIDPATRLPAPNIYVTATSAYGLPIVGPDDDGDGVPERLEAGAADADWMEGLFGTNNGGGPGSVWKIDGLTGEAYLFANIGHDRQANGGASLGNIAFDAQNRQLFVSDRETGLIHRLDLDGNEFETFDHGVTGRGAAGVETVALDRATRADITASAFKPADPATWGLADPRRRVWGLAVFDGRLFYAVAEGPQIWSIGLNSDGSLDALTTRLELDLPAEVESHEIADIAFSGSEMILAQRPPASGAADFRQLALPGNARVLRYRLESPDDPATPGRWTEPPEEFAIGVQGEYRNANGGVALGYGHAPDGAIDRDSCAATLWATGDRLRLDPLQPNGADDKGSASGVQGTPAAVTRSDDPLPADAFVIDYDGQYPQVEESGHVGDVEIAHRCPPAILAELPGVPGPPGAAPGPLPSGVAAGPPPPGAAPQSAPSAAVPSLPPAQPADLAIEKKLAGPCLSGGDCAFEIVVTNQGPGEYQGPLVLSDSASIRGVALAADVPAPWHCQPAGEGITCTHPTRLIKPGHPVSLPLTLRDPGDPNINSWDNCAVLQSVSSGADTEETVRAVQVELAALGYYSGAIDGFAGNETEQAIRDLEKVSGLAETGKITPEFLDWLFGQGASTAIDSEAGNDGPSCVTVNLETLAAHDPPHPPEFDLSIEKSLKQADVTAPGAAVLDACSWNQPCSFIIKVTNIGPGNYEGPLIVKDDMPAGWELVRWTGPTVCEQQGDAFSCSMAPQTTLTSGQSVEWTLELQPGAVSDLGMGHGLSGLSVQNCARIDWKGSRGDVDATNDGFVCATVSMAPAPPVLEIAKTSDLAQCERGKICPYTIRITNSGSAPFSGKITVEDRDSSAFELAGWSSDSGSWECRGYWNAVRCESGDLALAPGEQELIHLQFELPIDLPASLDNIENSAKLITDTITKETHATTPLKPIADLRVEKVGPGECWPESIGRCRYEIFVSNEGKVPYEGPITVVDANDIESTKLRSYEGGSALGPAFSRNDPSWKCSDGPGPGNIKCEYPHVRLEPNWVRSVVVEVDLNAVPPDVNVLSNCAIVFYTGGAQKHQHCVHTPLQWGQYTYTARQDLRAVELGVLFPPFCVAEWITDPASKFGQDAKHCTDYEFVIASMGKVPYDGPMTLRVEMPPGSTLESAQGKESAPSCLASGWSCSNQGSEVVCRPSTCELEPGETVSVLTDVSLLGGSFPQIPPDGIDKTVCGELEWFAPSDPSGIEQQGERRISRACGTTRVLFRPKEAPEAEPSDLQVSTGPQGTCTIGQTCLVGTTIANVGENNFVDEIEIQGQVTPPVSIRAVRPPQRGWDCRTVGGGRYTCTGKSTEFAPDTSAEFQLALAIPRNFQHERITHSVRLVWPEGNGDANAGNDASLFTIKIAAPSPPPVTAPPPPVTAPPPSVAAPPPSPSCRGGKVRVGSRCVCPGGTTEVRGRCVRPQAASPPPPAAAAPPRPACTGGKIAMGNRCVCPQGTIDVLGGCLQIQAAPPPRPAPQVTQPPAAIMPAPPPPPPPPPVASPQPPAPQFKMVPSIVVCPGGQKLNQDGKCAVQ